MNHLLRAQQFLLSILREGAILGDYGAIYTDKKEIFDRMIREFSVKQEITWKKEKDWSLKNVFPERYKKQGLMIDEVFVPLLNKDQIIADLACANGEWSLYVADHVKHIDGYEFSKRMVKTAKRRAKESNNKNVSFYHADACKVSYPRQYDHFMMLGLLTCITDPADIGIILNKVASALAADGYLLTKDTLNTAGKDVIYLYNSATGYQAAYYSQEVYYKYFADAGFQLEQETLLDEVKTDGMTFISRGTLWRKYKRA